MKKYIVLGLACLPWIASAQHFGQKNHEMHSGVDNKKVINYWETNTPQNIEIYETIDEVLAANRTADFGDVLKYKKYQQLQKKYDLILLGGPMLGDVRADGISIWVRTAQPARVKVVVDNQGKPLTSKTISTAVQSDLAGVVAIQGLKPSTTYRYHLVINDQIVVKNEKYQFTTAPATANSNNTRIAFGSCSHRWGLGHVQMFNTIKQRQPAAMFLLGDIVVQDRDNNLGMHRADHLIRDLQTAWSDFACGVPVYANWDDHDYFGNDKTGIPKGYVDQDRRDVRNVFKNSWVNPYYGENEEGIYFKTEIGPATIAMTDNRYFREDSKGVFLGNAQMEWLKSEIKNCKSPFLVLSCGTMWSDFVSEGKDSWGAINPKGREEIFDLIENSCVSQVILISGDRHGARGFTIQRNSGFELFEFEAASLGARVGPPASKPEWKTQLYGIDGTFAFGELTFEGGKKSAKATYRLIDEKGQILFEKELLHKSSSK